MSRGPADRSAHMQSLGVVVLKLTLQLLKERGKMQALFRQVGCQPEVDI